MNVVVYVAEDGTVIGVEIDGEPQDFEVKEDSR